jgi:hypothetical protein
MNNKTQYSTRQLPAPSPSPSGISSQEKAAIEAKTQPTEHDPITNRTRYGVIRENLCDGLSFLKEQDRLLSFSGEVLDELRGLVNSDQPEIVLRRQILLQALADVESSRYKQTSLFGNGTESPLKIHVVVNGERQVVEIEKANLRQPGFQSAIQCAALSKDACFRFKPDLAASAIAEVLNLRFRNQQQIIRLEMELKRVECRLTQAANSHRRLFEDPVTSEPTVQSQSSFQRISASARQIGEEVFQRVKTFCSAKPVWEEIPSITTTSRL